MGGGFGWHRTILGYQGPIPTLSLGFRLQRKGPVLIRVVALGSNGRAGEGNAAVLVEKNKLKEMREESESPFLYKISFSDVSCTKPTNEMRTDTKSETLNREQTQIP